MDNIDLTNLPENVFELKGKLFLVGIDERVSESIKYINTEYENKEKLCHAVDFTDNILQDVFKSDYETLTQTGFFPVTEAQMEFDNSIKHALIGSYKAAYDHTRRALELTLLGIYFTSEYVDKQEAIQWLISEAKTPMFTNKIIETLSKIHRFKKMNSVFNWVNDIKKLYWDLCDFVHVKGVQKGFRELNKTNFWFEGTALPTISKLTLREFLNNFIRTVEYLCSALVLYNPIILTGVPLDEKFGLNGPFSGFLYETQAEIVNILLPEKYREFFAELKEKDEEVLGLVDWFNSIPDITGEELKQQIKEQNEFLSRNVKKKEEREKAD